MTAPDIFASRKFVAHYSGTLNPSNTDFYELRLGPDKKIYIHPYDWSFTLHVIHQPDSSGTACGFVENGLQINPPGLSWNSFPNTVNYHLGPLYGSGCDTLTDTSELPEPVFGIALYPNPFSNQFQTSVSGAFTKALIEVYDVLGRKMFASEFEPINYFIHQAVDMKKHSSGIYFISVQVNGLRHIRKVVKQ